MGWDALKQNGLKTPPAVWMAAVSAAVLFHAILVGVLHFWVPLPSGQRSPLSFEIEIIEVKKPAIAPDSNPQSPVKGDPPQGKAPVKSGANQGRDGGKPKPNGNPGADDGNSWIPVEDTSNGTKTNGEDTVPVKKRQLSDFLPHSDPGGGELQPQGRGPSGASQDPLLTGVTAPSSENPISYKPDGKGNFVHETPNFVVAIDGSTGAIRFRNRVKGFLDVEKELPGVKMGGNELLYSLLGEDPYRNQKLKIYQDPVTQKKLKQIFAQRIESDKRRAYSDAVGVMKALWASAQSAEIKREKIFEYWLGRSDDIGDDTPGVIARRCIEKFIRDNLPEGSAYAYTQKELAAIHERLKKEKALFAFQPYRKSSEEKAESQPTNTPSD